MAALPTRIYARHKFGRGKALTLGKISLAKEIYKKTPGQISRASLGEYSFFWKRAIAMDTHTKANQPPCFKPTFIKNKKARYECNGLERLSVARLKH
jgi:hypothetical protein